jgi:A/G-specific adenine glycosylase
MSSNFVSYLLNWYAQHARILPWRGVVDPYKIWVSEIMLQQTRVETVIPYYQRWMKRYPTVDALASASQQEVLSLWEGLGYYSRARNLHRAAQVVISEYGGQLPAHTRQLQTLPGIGRYTAAAIASIAFGLDEPALDGNIRRVLARVFNVTKPSRSSDGERQLWELVGENLPSGRAGEYNQAMMDLGAQICTPRDPDCPNCPLADLCQANALGIQEERPVSAPKPALPHNTVTAAVIRSASKVLITRRPQDGLLGGMWEFPGGKLEEGEDLTTCLQREICEEIGVEIGVGDNIGVYKHAYTHFKVTLYAFNCSLIRGEPKPIEVNEVRWVYVKDLTGYPMGKIDRQIASSLGSV